MSDEFFTKALELERAGKPFVTATVVRVEPPTSGKPGDKAIITLDGEVYGWIGGSCTRPVVEEEARAVLEEDRSRLVRLAADSDEAARREGLTDLSMTCYSGGTMEIYVEPHPPKIRLLLVGEQPIARSLARLGQAMGYQVLAVRSPGEEASLPEAEEHLDTPDGIGEHVHPLTYVVVATHGDHDEVALESALRAGAPWVGLVASRKRAASIREFLEGRGLGEDDLAVLSVPAGLDIGARHPEEIALSILAEIVQHRHGREKIDWTGTATGNAQPADAESPAALETATDPICGMTVQIAGARHIHEYQDTLYYFCCGGCKSRFAADPEGCLAARPTA
jgi:xanthine dehydrogenase accessory factor